MKKIAIIIGIFFLIGFLNTTLFIQYLKTTKLPGGEAGMAPFIIIITSAISLVISVLVYLIINLNKKISIVSSIAIYHFVYFVGLIVWGLDWQNLFSIEYINLDLFIILIAILVWGVTTLFYKFLVSKWLDYTK